MNRSTVVEQFLNTATLYKNGITGIPDQAAKSQSGKQGTRRCISGRGKAGAAKDGEVPEGAIA